MAIKPTKEELEEIAENRRLKARRQRDDVRREVDYNSRVKATKDIATILAKFPAEKIDNILKDATDTHPGYRALQEERKRVQDDADQRARWERDGKGDITS